jgi:hypothetical protein
MDDPGRFSGGLVHQRQVIGVSGRNESAPARLGVGERNQKILDPDLHVARMLDHPDEFAVVGAPPPGGG